MPCLLVLLMLCFPRVVLVCMWFFTNYLQRAYHHELLFPILGFIFAPITTIVYAWEVNNNMPLAGINLVWLVIAVLIDFGGLGTGARHQSRR